MDSTTRAVAAAHGSATSGTAGAAAVLDLSTDALDPALQAGLVQTDGEALTFRHPLIRSAVYESALLGQRQRTHAALADALLAEQHADRAVWHQARATLTAAATIAAALKASGRRSQERGGHASAASAFERAVELSDSEPARVALLVLAAEAAYVAGQADRARPLLARSLPLADRAQRARLLFFSGAIEGRHGWLRDGIAALQQAAALSESASLTLAEGLDDPVCLVWAAWTVARASGAGDGLSYASRAVDIARERGLMTALSFALQMQADGLIAPSRFDLVER